jgi:hypothetical protein
MSIRLGDCAVGTKVRNSDWKKNEYFEVIYKGNEKAFLREDSGEELVVWITDEYDEIYVEPEPEKLPSKRIKELGGYTYGINPVPGLLDTSDCIGAIWETIFSMQSYLDEDHKKRAGKL